MRNYPEWVFSFMAVTSQGCVSVPTNSLWVGAEIEYALNDSGAAVVFCDGQRAALLIRYTLVQPHHMYHLSQS